MEKFVITIGREYGSGGRQIGEIVAKTLGINFYDKNLITLAGQRHRASSGRRAGHPLLR